MKNHNLPVNFIKCLCSFYEFLALNFCIVKNIIIFLLFSFSEKMQLKMDNTNSSSPALDEQSLLSSQQSSMDYNSGETSTSANTRKKMYSTVPISRVNAIMRSCPNLTTVRNDAIALTSQAAELFIQDLVQNAFKLSPDKENLTYNTLADFIAESKYSFLREAIPQKITVQQYKELKRQHEIEIDNDENDDGDDNDEEDEDEEEESNSP